MSGTILTNNAFPFYDNLTKKNIELLALVLSYVNTAKNSTTESKQTEGSRCLGVSHSVLVGRIGRLAVTHIRNKF